MKTSLIFSLAVVIGAALLSGCSREQAAPAAPAAARVPAASALAAEAAPVAAPAAASVAGAAVYAKVCALCHAAGVGGAPRPGDKADWAPRIAQGEQVLFSHAIGGFTGAKGSMPAKGGSPGLSDEDVKSAVTHMVSLSR